jgi:hypothetical protein
MRPAALLVWIGVVTSPDAMDAGHRADVRTTGAPTPGRAVPGRHRGDGAGPRRPGPMTSRARASESKAAHPSNLVVVSGWDSHRC